MEALYITYPLNGLLMIALGAGAGITITRKFRLGWRLFAIGALTFLVSQVGHIPFNYFLTVLFQRGILPSPPVTWHLPFNAIVLGLSAGLWEEVARYAMYRWWAREARTWSKALLLGAGHGGIEAIALGAYVLYIFFVMFALRGADPSVLAERGATPQQLALLQQQISAYWSSPWYLTLFGALERAFTIPVQISLSVIVLQTFARKQHRWLWLAIAWHTLIDAVSVYASGTWNVTITEALIAVSALLSIVLIFALRQPETEPIPAEPVPLTDPVAKMHLPPVAETIENLEKTRYN